MNSHEVFIHIHQGCFAGTGAIVRLPQCQWSKPDGYGKISQCITTTKHSKAKTVCIFLGIYCTSDAGLAKLYWSNGPRAMYLIHFARGGGLCVYWYLLEISIKLLQISSVRCPLMIDNKQCVIPRRYIFLNNGEFQSFLWFLPRKFCALFWVNYIGLVSNDST